MKKVWEKPGLVVLRRGDTGETVLGSCKHVYYVHSGPGADGTACSSDEDCQACSAFEGS